jgi:DNA-binding NtrC family response regulator
MYSLSVSDIKRLLQQIPAEAEKVARLLEDGLSGATKFVKRKLADCIVAINLHDAQTSEDSKPMDFIWITGEPGLGKRELVYKIHKLVDRKDFYELEREYRKENVMPSKLSGDTKNIADDSDEPEEGFFWLSKKGLVCVYEPQTKPIDWQDGLLRWQRTGIIPYDERDNRLKLSDAVIIFVSCDDPRPLAKKKAMLPGLVMNSLVHIHIPPLREHSEDIVLLIEHLLRAKGHERRGEEFSLTRNMEDEALFLLVNLHWRDNANAIREVVKYLIHKVLFGDFNQKITVHDVLEGLDMRYDENPLDIIAPLFKRIKQPRIVRDDVRMDELKLLRCLWDCGFNEKELAKAIGISHFKISRQFGKAGLENPVRPVHSSKTLARKNKPRA